MILSTADKIMRGWLLKRGYPIHFYSEVAFHTCECIKMLCEDTLQVIQSANIPVESDGSVYLPDDFSDDLGLFLPIGGVLSPLAKQDYISPLRIHDTTTGQFVPPIDVTAPASIQQFFGFPSTWQYFWNVDDYANFQGRQFGGHGGTEMGYKVFREQRRIQVTYSFGGSVVLLYVGDGGSANNASQVDSRAVSCIQSFIDWQRSPNAAIKDSYEAHTFYNEKRRLRSLLNDTNITDIKNIFRRGYTAGIKF